MAYRGPYGGGGYRGGYGGGMGGPGSLSLGARLTPAVKYLLIANVAVFFLNVLIRKFFSLDLFVIAGSLVPSLVFPGLQIWRVATYMFLHADGSHLFFNMLALFFFGPQLEQVWGSKKFMTYYLATGIGAGIVCVPFYLLIGSDAYILGASGAIFGVLVAFALIYPNALVYFMFLLPIKAKYLVLFFVVIEFVSTAQTLGGSAVAHVAHLGGAVIGYFYLRRLNDLKFYWLRFKTRKRKRPYRVIQGGPPDDEDERPGPWLH